MGETRVDLHHLLEDLRDAYPESLEETIVTEIVANALDSKATEIAFTPNPSDGTLLVVDNGKGMTRRALRSYHDLATTTKRRGQGIGFAGVGIKLGLLACDEVITETRSGKTPVATTWRLASQRRAPWRWIEPPGFVGDRGTAVRLRLRDPLSMLIEDKTIVAILERHFAPLLDPTFATILSTQYPDGVRFRVAGRLVPALGAPDGAMPLAVRIGRKRRPSAVGYMVRGGEIEEGDRGIAVSTLGKVIKRGWDWIGVSPSAPERIRGILEVPALAACLTLNKADFIRTGERGALYLAHRGGMQKAVAAVLAEWGDGDRADEEQRRRKTRKLERDLENVLADLADAYPLLATLVERHRGGQRRLPLGEGKGALGPTTAESATAPPGDALDSTSKEPETPAAPPPPPTVPPPVARGKRRPARYALTIRFEERPDEADMGRLVESTVWINSAHPAYGRAVRTRSEPYHIAVAVALAIAPLAVTPESIHGFVNEFLGKWGTGEVRTKRRARKRR